MTAGSPVPPSAALAAVLADGRRRAAAGAIAAAGVALAIAAAFAYAGAFDLARYRDAAATIATLIRDALPPDFGRLPHWGRPLAETLAMSVAGTALAAAAALPLGLLAARGIGPSWCRRPVRMALDGLRAIPGLMWGVLFVAAVGFGPLPGLFALACHSTGMLGKFYAEIFEHVEPGPGDALRCHGVSRLGVLRFGVLPQCLPRLVDATLYRWEHNVRAATVLGVVGAGGLGLEIVTAFHLFEYREALALILVLLALVSAINYAGARLRAWFLTRE